MSASIFPHIEISGNAEQRGLAHGEQMAGQIVDALSFYKDIFKLSDEVILERATHFKKVIADFNPDYAAEIVAIAHAANLDPLWIFALNARTELIALTGGLFTNECTSMCFPQPTIIGQTWDWGEPLEELCALVKITRPDGHIIQMLTEPGILGKIGMNNAGLGVCLNILSIDKKTDGLPIHVMLRAILDCKTSRQAASLIKQVGGGKSSNVIIADKSGDCFDTEFAGDETLEPDRFGDNIIHTNHYLAKPINDLTDPVFENSIARLTSARKGLETASKSSVDTMKNILSDRSNPDNPIYRPYKTDDHLGKVGTVATFVMDLPTGNLHIRKGNADGRQFQTLKVG